MDVLTLVGIGALIYILVKPQGAAAGTQGQISGSSVTPAQLAQLKQSQATNSLLSQLLKTISGSSQQGKGGGSGGGMGSGSGGGTAPSGKSSGLQDSNFGSSMVQPKAWDDPFVDQYIQRYNTANPSTPPPTVDQSLFSNDTAASNLASILNAPSSPVTRDVPTEPVDTNQQFVTDGGFPQGNLTVPIFDDPGSVAPGYQIPTLPLDPVQPDTSSSFELIPLQDPVGNTDQMVDPNQILADSPNNWGLDPATWADNTNVDWGGGGGTDLGGGGGFEASGFAMDDSSL